MKTTTFLFISLLVLMNFSKAQKASFGITAGTAFATYKATIESISITSKTKVGFTTGVLSSIPVGKNFSFQPALNFIQKGGVLKEEDTHNKMTLNYLELPLNLVYSTHSVKGKFFFGAGPSLSMGLSGKYKWHDDYDSGTDDIKFGSDKDVKTFEAGINFLAGYQLKGGLFIAANYNTALSDIANDDGGGDYDTKFHNRYFGVRLGCMFGSRKSK